VKQRFDIEFYFLHPQNNSVKTKVIINLYLPSIRKASKGVINK
jgi:hypothetical protein